MAKVRKRTWSNSKGERTAWVADYSDQDGKRHIKTFETKKAATAWLVTAQGEVARGVHTPDRSSITVAEAVTLWLNRCRVEGLERTTIDAYTYALNLHVLPVMGKTRLARLTTPIVEAYKDELLKSISRNRARQVVGFLKSALSDAARRGLVAQNVATPVKIGSRGRHEKKIEIGIQIPSKDDLNLLLTAAGPRWRPFIVTAAFTGMRTSELRGLLWSDVDLSNKVIRVRQRVDSYRQMGSPKSADGRRDIPMSPMVVNALREWKLACPTGALMLVFPNGIGNPETHTNVVRRFWRPLQRELGLVDDTGEPKYDFHSLRHFAASWFIESGMAPKKVQALLGHATLAMTYDLYGHLFPDLEDDHAKLAAAERGLGIAT
jgi:integrase